MYKIKVSCQYRELEFYALSLLGALKAFNVFLSSEMWDEERVALEILLQKSWPREVEGGAYEGWRTDNNRGVLEIEYLQLWE